MNANLTTELTERVQLKVKSGRYNSASKVVHDAHRLPAERDEPMELRKQELRRKIAQGVDSLRRGEGLDGDEFFARLECDEMEIERKFQPAFSHRRMSLN